MIKGLFFTRPQGSTGLEITASSVQESAEVDFPAGAGGRGKPCRRAGTLWEVNFVYFVTENKGRSHWGT